MFIFVPLIICVIKRAGIVIRILIMYVLLLLCDLFIFHVWCLMCIVQVFTIQRIKETVMVGTVLTFNWNFICKEMTLISILYESWHNTLTHTDAGSRTHKRTSAYFPPPLMSSWWHPCPQSVVGVGALCVLGSGYVAWDISRKTRSEGQSFREALRHYFLVAGKGLVEDSKDLVSI